MLTPLAPPCSPSPSLAVPLCPGTSCSTSGVASLPQHFPPHFPTLSQRRTPRLPHPPPQPSPNSRSGPCRKDFAGILPPPRAFCVCKAPLILLRVAPHLCSRLRFEAIAGCGYGCVAFGDVSPGDVLVTVPSALVISSDAAMESRCDTCSWLMHACNECRLSRDTPPAPQPGPSTARHRRAGCRRPRAAPRAVRECASNCPPPRRPPAYMRLSCNCTALHCSLFLKALLSLQADSEWRLYFDFLPRDFHTPLQWNDAELLLLQASHHARHDAISPTTC